ncbi:MAG: glycosyltransferase family 2 protein [Patescibacteria group bacterium]|nr:glycosyltransferase family 2 protein [Patescibacteria group bacterium]
MTALTYTLLFFSLYFEVFLLVSFLERKFYKHAGARSFYGTADMPSVAIVVPSYNEERTIESTLKSLAVLDYPKGKLEILVVDDGSTDGTGKVACAFAAQAGAAVGQMPTHRLTILHKENGGKHTAMNLALQHTNAELIGCLDADSVVAPDALLNVVHVFRDERVSAVTPGIHVREPSTLLQHMQNVEYRISIFSRFMLATLGSVFITPGPFSVFRSSVVRELGGWRYGHSTEDMEMALRMQLAGHLIANAPRAIVHTATPANLRGLFRQRVRWTYGWLRNALDYRSIIGNRKFGTLGLIVLPAALISILTIVFFFVRVLVYAVNDIAHGLNRIAVTGAVPPPHFDPFYIDTSAMWLIVWVSVLLIIVFVTVGSFIGTGSRRPPIGTPLFILFYGFLVPLWVSVALVRATFNTGVRWK